jgi:hypothetical protein
MDGQLLFRMIMINPTAGVVYGIQKGKGSQFETIQKQLSEGNDLDFECSIPVKFDENNQPVFSGPFAQGPAGGKFIYIDIGSCAGQANTPWSRRLKIPLKDITREMLQQPGTILETRVQGSNSKDGSPTCGTTKPFNGWKAVVSVKKTEL